MRHLALPFFLFPGLLALSLPGCSESYSPNTYDSTAAQQQATVERGFIIGVRPVLISADGTVGAATGGAAGGVAGAQLPGNAVTTAFGAIGGTLIGGLSGAAAEKAIGDAKGWEYIVQETGDKLISITQTSKTALPVGLNVLVIADTQQARIVPDYTVQISATALSAQAAVTNAAKTTAASNSSTNTEVNLSPFLPATDDPIIPSQSTPASADPAVTPLTTSSPPGETITP